MKTYGINTQRGFQIPRLTSITKDGNFVYPANLYGEMYICSLEYYSRLDKFELYGTHDKEIMYLQ